MTKLSKSQIIDRDNFQTDLSDRYDDLEKAIETYNNQASEAWDMINDALTVYNQAICDAWGDLEVARGDYVSALEEASTWASEVAGEIEDTISEKSGKWQESDRGQAYVAWKEAYDLSFEEPNFEQPDEAAIEEPPKFDIGDVEDAVAVLGDLPEEPES